MWFRLWQVRMDSLLSYKMQGHIFRCIYSCLYQLISSAHVQCGRTYGRCMKLKFRNECFSHPPGVNRPPNVWWYTIEAVRPNARFSTAPMKYFPNIFCQHVCSSYERWIWFYARWANSGRTLCLGKLYYLHPAQPPTIKLIFDHHPSGQRTSSKNKKTKCIIDSIWFGYDSWPSSTKSMCEFYFSQFAIWLELIGGKFIASLPAVMIWLCMLVLLAHAFWWMVYNS